MLRKISIYVMVLLLLFISKGLSQEILPSDSSYWAVEEASAGNFFGVGARAMGMGGVQIATANDASALVYNPALLAKIKRIEFSGAMSHQRLRNETGLPGGIRPLSSFFQNESIIQSNTRFSSANIVLPVPTYRGSLVFALGFNRMKSFDKAFRSVLVDPETGLVLFDASVLETGGINMWSFGGALDLSPNVSVGVAVNYWQGEDDYLQDYYLSDPSKLSGYEIWEKNRYLNSYSGWNGKLGFSVQPARFLSLGAVVDFPTKFSIDQTNTYSYDSLDLFSGESYTPPPYDSLGHYELTHPYSFGAGTAFNFKYITLAGDIYYTDWSQLKPSARIGVDEKLYKEIYKTVTRWHIGAEVVLPELNTKFRIGFYKDPLPYITYKSIDHKTRLNYLETDRRYFTLGAGFLIDQVLTLDVAWNHGFHEFKDNQEPKIKESYTADKIFVSLAYRL
jgi:hypothetical protein